MLGDLLEIRSHGKQDHRAGGEDLVVLGVHLFDTTLNWAESERGFACANERVVNDWLAAIIADREPVCSGHAGMRALEMALAVFAAGLARVELRFL